MRHWKKLLMGTLLPAMLVAATVETTSSYNIFIDHSFNLYDAGITAWLASWGNTVTVVSNYGGEDLSGYDIVMDYDYDAWHLLTVQEQSAYRGVLNRGAGLYLQGERPTDTYRAHD